MTRPGFAPRGFTLIELLVVLAIVALMLTIVAPRTIDHLARSREAALKTNLHELRRVIDQFEADTGRPPASLEELVARRYLREIPIDPVNDRRDAWITVSAAEAEAARSSAAGATGGLLPFAGADDAAAERPGVVDVHSGAEGDGRDGTPYRSW